MGVEGTEAVGGGVGTVVELWALWVISTLGGGGDSWTSGLLAKQPMGQLRGPVRQWESVYGLGHEVPVRR